MPARRPSYLRAVVTTRCPMNCTYCHMEGDPGGARPARLDTGALTALLRVAARSGIHRHAPHLVARLPCRGRDRDAETVLGQERLQQLPNAAVIVDDQDVRGLIHGPDLFRR